MSWTTKAAEVLENDVVRLEAVAPGHRDGLRAVALDPDIWDHFTTVIRDSADFEAYFDGLLERRLAGSHIVYVVVDRASGRVAGSMAYGNLAESEARLEIGGSWLGRDFRGRGVNRQAKYLLMEQAFEQLGAERVEFKTDVLNARARKGLRNIGAVQEGVLRSYNYMPGGRRRDAIFYSVLRAEWPAVKARLTAADG